MKLECLKKIIRRLNAVFPLQKTLGRILLSLLFTIGIGVFLHFPGAGVGFSQEEDSIAPNKKLEYDSLEETIEISLKSEMENIKRLKEWVTGIDREKSSLAGEIGAYKIQHASYVNLLLLPGMEIKDFEKAMNGVQTSLFSINDRLKELREKHHLLKEMHTKLEEQYAVNEKEMMDIRSQGAGNPEIRSLVQQMKELLALLTRETDHLEKLLQFYSLQIDQMEEIRSLFEELMQKFEAQIIEKKRQDLFLRTDNSFSSLRGSQIWSEIQKIMAEVRMVFSGEFWISEINTLWKSGEYFFIAFILLFAFTQALFFRMRKYCLLAVDHPVCSQCSMLKISLMLLHRSIMMLGAALFLFIYTQLGPVTRIIEILLYIVQVFLYTRWGLDTIRFWEQVKGYSIHDPLRRLLRSLLFLIRYSVCVYVVIAWILDANSGILLFARIVFDIGLIFWCVLLGKRLKGIAADGKDSQKYHLLIPAITGLSYSIAVIGFFLELAGYGSLSVFWYLSVGKTAIVALWAGMSYFILHEWDQAFQVKTDETLEESEKIKITFKWLFTKVAQIVWIAALFVSVVIAWGGRQPMLINIFKILKHPVPLGNINFSLMGVIQFTLALLITHAMARIWRYFFQTKFLKQSGMEIGLQDSMTTITVYLIWAIGILISLHMIGFNTTSLAVAFGALGIGLGFGLQNIFNNFISGIILLFERPIQIGDDIEINGIWATVKKINVRSTVVQTYDNASLIIPNSDLISNQVINWSFKDKRLRRNITIGVAYGSDISMVRETLLEIAEKTPRVLKFPKPNVIFTDFGDNALIFKLRFWTHVDYFLEVETDVRFEIDRIFREKNISIPFPQQDVHIYYNAPPSSPEKEAEAKKSQGVKMD